ncbi:ABC transporter permease [Streptomyces sp. NPDC058486]|uniref:ABC transporter permease n=1 Tax=unclassified Streptomyces TaxID=2593676 RepID=UPI003667FC65
MTTSLPVRLPPAEAPPRFRHPLAAEWTKLWSLRSTPLVLGVGALVVTGINVNAARSNADRLSELPEVAGLAYDPLGAAFVDPAWQILMVIAACLGAVAVSGEYTTGLAHTTFTAVPDRRAVVMAKAAVVTAVTLVLGTVVALLSFGLTQALLRDHGGLSLADPGALRAVVGSALLAPVCALTGMAAGALVRHAAGSIVAVIGTLLLLPALFQGETYRWVKETGNLMPLSAWSALVRNPARPVLEAYPVTVPEAWAVLGGWAVAGFLITVVAVRHRDV